MQKNQGCFLSAPFIFIQTKIARVISSYLRSFSGSLSPDFDSRLDKKRPAQACSLRKLLCGLVKNPSVGLSRNFEKTPRLFLTRFLLSFHRLEKKETVWLEDKTDTSGIVSTEMSF